MPEHAEIFLVLVTNKSVIIIITNKSISILHDLPSALSDRRFESREASADYWSMVFFKCFFQDKRSIVDLAVEGLFFYFHFNIMGNLIHPIS